MDAVKSTFSIKDLECFGGVKAHTIRMWERRYNLLEPKRTDTNIRYYDLADLQKLLNVTFLLQHDYKISKVAEHSTEEIAHLVQEFLKKNRLGSNYHAISSFKIAMMNFDHHLFTKTFNTLSEKMEFRKIFFQVFIPLLEEIGLLWQSNAINPAHEHFISNLIRQKMQVKIESYSANNKSTSSKTFVLFLPENEIHDLGLIFLNYEVAAKGFKYIYLGQSIQTESLKYLVSALPDAHFVSYMTINSNGISIAEFARQFNRDVESDKVPLYLLGRLIHEENQADMPSNVKLIKTIEAFQTLLN
ncbi:MerR family transcriptional regulator [Leeuwenhoekiella parthenopeia]|uniref:MerR family transcriptional regulator n=1 Tax=Leeuwenhoekiella parthenopeia TaxID=2890320 RepID=A0ABS8GME1_9FLAO|nr:MerR family transcriptional regulator [Leeuwenhoekiella parthenopeia]MCC4211144.1 MerR family transcriptional regulator [Leeuwenhoekiella parthenopeia]